MKEQEETAERLECKSGIKNMGTILQLRLKLKRTPYGFNRKVLDLNSRSEQTGCPAGCGW
jgi:hypothetical protein